MSETRRYVKLSAIKLRFNGVLLAQKCKSTNIRMCADNNLYLLWSFRALHSKSMCFAYRQRSGKKVPRKHISMKFTKHSNAQSGSKISNKLEFLHMWCTRDSHRLQHHKEWNFQRMNSDAWHCLHDEWEWGILITDVKLLSSIVVKNNNSSSW